MRQIISLFALVFLVLAVSTTAQAAPPIIYFQPEGMTNLVGEDTFFWVEATGDNELTHQWRKNGVNLNDNARISGATDFILQISDLTSSDTGNYSVVVKDSITGESRTSSNAYLKVLTGPSIKIQPQDKAILAGSTVTFGVSASGSAPLRYQWFRDWYDIPGATNASLVLTNVQSEDEGEYYAEVSNEAVDFGADPAVSMPAILTVLVPVEIIEQPESVVAVEGDSVDFEVVINDDATDTFEYPLTYQWRKNGFNLADETDPILSLGDITSSQAGTYTVRIANGAGSVISSKATLTVYVPPAITTEPADRLVKAGSTATFTARATGTPPLSYQWFFNDVEMPGKTSSTLTFLVKDKSQEGAYWVTVSNPAVMLDEEYIETSDQAILTVQAETIKPTVSVTRPAEGARWSDAVVDVQGRAADNVAVQEILWQVNGGDWQQATGFSSAPNTAWSALSVPLNAGTNVFRARSVDTSGNKSAYALRTVFHVVPSPLTLLTNGLGRLVLNPPARSNLLEIGRRYTLTATPVGGFAFVNWDGDIESSNRFLSFLMATNLTLRANFKDIAKPTVVINSPRPNARLTDAVVTFQGTARDNFALDRVEYQLNDGPFIPAIGTSNWSATVTLAAGTNVFRVRSVDTTTNESVVASRNVFHVVPSPLTLLTNGLGRLVLNPPARSNLLEISRRYTLTATPVGGFAFVNWDGDIESSNRFLSFLMATNLTLRANFKDIAKPTVVINSPRLNARLTNEVVAFEGTARDNFALDRVEYQLNDEPFDLATGTTNWSATVSLTAGTNVFRVKSIDTTTNESVLASRSVFFVVPSPLSLLTNGKGRIAGATNGQWLEVGRSYRVTAIPALRHLFALWSGDLWSTNPVLNFLMQSNLTLQANFVTNPFVGLKGTYYGLFAETNEVRNHARSGSFTLTLAEAGSYSANFRLGAQILRATGRFDWLGQSLLRFRPSPTSTVMVALQLDVTNRSARLEGVVSHELWTSPLAGFRAPVYLGTNVSPRAGRYTVALLHTEESPEVPGGDGFGAINVTRTGFAQFTGTMADGTPVTQRVPVSEDGEWPFYSSLYRAGGSAYGWGILTNRETSSIEGNVSWIKPAVPGPFYPAGFNTRLAMLGSHYQSPPRGVRVLNLTNGEIVFVEGGLPAPLTNSVFLTTNNTVAVTSGTNKLVLKFMLTAGTASGSFIHPVTRRSSRINGILLPEDSTVAGFFLSTNQSGAVILYSTP